MKPELWDEVEKYLSGELRGDDLRSFENKMQTDAAFAAKVEEHKKLFNELDFYKKRQGFKDELNEIHEGISGTEAKTVSLTKRKRYTASFAIAASIGLVALLFAFIASLYLYRNDEVSYKELKKDINQIKKNQHYLAKEVQSITEAEDEISSEGTAFPVSNRGIFLTSYHITKGAKTITLQNKKFGSYRARVIKEDIALDLALLKVEDTAAFSKYSKIPFSLKIKECRLAEKVYALGFPKDNLVYTEGTVSSDTGYDEDTTSFQVSIPVNPGHSGSPVFDNSGNVAGMIKGTDKYAALSSFAVKASYLNEFLSSVKPVKTKTTLGKYSREQQVEKLSDYTFMVRTYKGR